MLLHAEFVLACATVVAASAQHHWGRGLPNFENLIVFGDSYSDESRLVYFANHNGSAPPVGVLLPPSNATAVGGPIWGRYVADFTGAILYDYAVSGAVCSNDIISRYYPGIHQDFPDVVYQTGAFVADTKYVDPTTHVNPLYSNRNAENTAYVLWLGGNDLGVDAFLTDSSLHMTTVPAMPDCIFNQFDVMYKAGARFFVLMNVPPFELTPLYGMPGAGGLTASHYWADKPANITEVSSKMKEYVSLVNTIYTYRVPYELLIAQRYPGASMALYDTNALMTDIYNNPSEYLESPANVTGQYYKCAVNGSGCSTVPGASADQFMWYDELHPTSRTEEAIAKEFVNVVKGTSKYATYW